LQQQFEPRAFYASSCGAFLAAEEQSILGHLSGQHVRLHASAEAEQIRAWTREVEVLKSTLRQIGPRCQSWSVLLEVSLFRLGKRIDAVVLSPGVVTVIEFKIGAHRFEGQHRIQTERYAHALRDFHEASQSRLIVPVLCCERAPQKPIEFASYDGVADLIEANAETLALALMAAANQRADVQESAEPDIEGFVRSAYRPTPTIVEAAQALYAGHKIAEIGRGDAADAELQRTADALKEILREAEIRSEKVVCFVTGAPGAGKTLLGLDLALASRSGTAPAALLSGNRPLVHVLTEALAVDASKRTGVTKAQAKYEADAAIQNLLGYLREHTDGATPPEHVIVFDEAQRAWDAEVGQELLGRPKSEPELFLDILHRLGWSCLVCLVGPGQEINRGEGGLALWGEALLSARATGQAWKVIAAPQALHGGPDVVGAGLFSHDQPNSILVAEDARLHLQNSIRAYRNSVQGDWIAALLDGRIPEARLLADDMPAAPVLLTRNLEDARAWLRQHRRGGRSAGLLCSSGAVRLIAEGIPPPPRSNELAAIGHWFLKDFGDFRSAGALEVPMSEFGCQGLELDYIGLCWGGDLIWGEDRWVARDMRAPKWQLARQAERQRFRLNGYRVLLTRARAGTVIYVPQGDQVDPTRQPAEFDAIADALSRAGASSLAPIS
jgi:hypothetical protein